jgi:phenylalanine-4-hydroxylase
MQECCCSTKQQVMQNNYDNAIGQANITKDMLLGQANNQKDILLGNKDIQAQLAQCCCDIKTTVKDENAMTRDLIQQNYISELSDKLNVARSQISNFEQSQYLLNTIGRYNVVSVPPYGSYNPYFGNQYYGVSSIA